MNRKQKVVFLVGLEIIVLMGLIPPWYYHAVFRGDHHAFTTPAPYGLLFAPPPSSPDLEKFRAIEDLALPCIDLSRLLVQWIVVAVAMAGIVFALKDDELKKGGASQEELNAAKERAKDQTSAGAKNLTGIRGMLLVSIILIVLYLLYSFAAVLAVGANMAADLSDVLFVPMFVLTTFHLFIGVYGVFAVCQLIMKKKSAPRRTLEWLCFALGVDILYIAFFALGKFKFSAEDGPAIVWLVLAPVFMTYFTKSKRVAITYGI